MATLTHILVGTWFVISSNFPMWLKGDKQEPTFHYTPDTRKGQTVLIDEVRYSKNGKTKSINGIDYPDAGKPNAYIWRGKGLLFVVKSKWQVRLMDEQQQWAVIYFSKTLFTPEGVDIISRQPVLNDATLQQIHKLILMVSGVST